MKVISLPLQALTSQVAIITLLVITSKSAHLIFSPLHRNTNQKQVEMGIDLNTYRARIGCNKVRPQSAVCGSTEQECRKQSCLSSHDCMARSTIQVSKGLFIVIAILLTIGGVETNPGPNGQKGSVAKDVETTCGALNLVPLSPTISVTTSMASELRRSNRIKKARKRCNAPCCLNSPPNFSDKVQPAASSTPFKQSKICPRYSDQKTPKKSSCNVPIDSGFLSQSLVSPLNKSDHVKSWLADQSLSEVEQTQRSGPAHNTTPKRFCSMQPNINTTPQSDFVYPAHSTTPKSVFSMQRNIVTTPKSDLAHLAQGTTPKSDFSVQFKMDKTPQSSVYNTRSQSRTPTSIFSPRSNIHKTPQSSVFALNTRSQSRTPRSDFSQQSQIEQTPKSQFTYNRDPQQSSTPKNVSFCTNNGQDEPHDMMSPLSGFSELDKTGTDTLSVVLPIRSRGTSRKRLYSEVSCDVDQYSASNTAVQEVVDLVHAEHDSVLLKKAKRDFVEATKQQMSFVCRVCHGLHFRKGVVKFVGRKYDMTHESVALALSVDPREKDGVSFLCNTCHLDLKKKPPKLPAQAVANDLYLDEIPPELSGLNELEIRFIAQRILFMKIVSLPKGGQKGMQGPCVNVPASIKEACHRFPRLAHQIDLVEFKLKRKISYKGHHMRMKVEPRAIMKGLMWLKAHNPFYKDIEVNVDWETYAAENEMMQIMTGDRVPNDPQDRSSKGETDKQLDKDFQMDQEAADANAQVTISPEASCIHPEEIHSTAFVLAPAEGNRPQSVLKDPTIEVLSFPNLFPKGRFAFDINHERKRKLYLRRYIDQRLMHYSGQFAQTSDYLFALQFRATVELVESQQSIALCMKKGNKINNEVLNAGMLKNKDRCNQLVQDGHAYKFLQKVRGSPAYWQLKMFETLSMVRSCGVPTFFLTLSAAEYHWPEMIQAIGSQYGENISEEEVKTMSWERKTHYLRRNPVTAVKLFENRVQSMFKFLKSDADPVGFLVDFIVKIEFQARGSPHAHCLLWIKDAPKLKEDPPEDVEAFVRKHCTAKIPEDDEELAALVTSRQKHSHSNYCRRSGQCRFNFPKPPSYETVVSKELTESIEDLEKLKQSKSILKKVHAILDEDTEKTLDEVLSKAQVSKEDYQNAVSVSSKGKVIILERDTKEMNVNCYNGTILKLWKANMDFQFVTDPISAVMYVCSYMMKSDAAMGETLKAVSREVRNEDVYTQMRKLGNAFLTAREVSQQEVIMLATGMQLMWNERAVKFVSCQGVDERVRFPRKDYKNLDDDDEDVFCDSLFDWYGARCGNVDMCLADFAVWYTQSTGNSSQGEDKDCDNAGNDSGDDNVDHIDTGCKVRKRAGRRAQDDPKNHPKVITCKLKGTARKYKKRERPAILRTYIPEIAKDSEKFYFGNLLLFCPWKSENEFESDSETQFEDFYLRHKAVVDENSIRYNYDNTDIEEAWRSITKGSIPVSAWDNIAPGAQEENAAAYAEGIVGIDRDFDVEGGDIPDQAPSKQRNDVLSKRFATEARKLFMSSADYHKSYMLLNECQQRVVDFNREWCKRAVAGLSVNPNCDTKAYNLFLSGPGGAGKSFVLKMVHRDTRYFFNLLKETIDPDNPRLLMTASTGTAAFIVEGLTLHSALSLGTGEFGKGGHLSDEKRSILQTRLQNLKTLVIDECSMVSPELLIQVHDRLSVAKGNCPQDPQNFGNVNVLCVGDPFQLPPVRARNIFEFPRSKGGTSHLSSLWSNFQFIELTQVMRQTNVTMANLLNKIRHGAPDEGSPEDLLLKSREVHVPDDSDTYPRDTLHVYAQNDQCLIRNLRRLDQLPGESWESVAHDKTKEKNTNVTDFIFPTNATKTGRMMGILHLKVGARVMLTDNIDVCDGLTNGALGTVTNIIPGQTSSSIFAVLVKFDHTKAGLEAKRKSKYKHVCPDSVPIVRVTKEFTIHDRQTLKFQRTQFPLFLSWAVTIHKVQGMTLDAIVVDMEKCKGKYQAGMAYVAFSRVREFENLHIVSYDRNQIKASPVVNEEMTRLREKCSVPRKPSFLEPNRDQCVTICCLNVRGIRSHSKMLCKLKEFKHSDILCLTETHMESRLEWNIESLPASEFSIFRSDRDCHGGGVAVCVQKRLTIDEIYFKTFVESVFLHVKAQIEFILVCIYRPPRICLGAFEKELVRLAKGLKDAYPLLGLCFVGDFNENLIQNPECKLLLSMNQLHFEQIVKKPTHDSGSLLDHVYKFNLDMTCDVCDCFFSDHDCVLLRVNM